MKENYKKLVILYARVVKRVESREIILKHINPENEVLASNNIKKNFKIFLDNPDENNFKQLWTKHDIWSANMRANATNILKKTTISEIVEVFKDMRGSSEYKEKWEKELSLKNSLREFWAKLKDEPLQNSCADHGLVFFGFKKESEYKDFLVEYNNFKREYLRILNNERATSFPIYIEIDQLFNFLHKSRLNDLDYTKMDHDISEIYRISFELDESRDYEEERSIKDESEINYYLLEKYFKNFSDFVKGADDNNKLSFSSGYLSKQEGYKDLIREQALRILKSDNMKKEFIGTGEIAKLVIKSVELSDNNLFIWQAKYGDKSRPHNSLYMAIDSGSMLNEYEQLLLDFFHSRIDDENAFNRFIKIAGKKYSYISYLFFIKNPKKYLPLAPNNFDNIFKMLKINLRTSKNCSWDNYLEYCGVVSEIQDYLKSLMNEDVSLVDAHSFLWVIGHQLQRPVIEQEIKIKEIIIQELRLAKLNKYDNKIAISKKQRALEFFDIEENIKSKREMKRRGDKAEMIVLEKEKELLNKAGRKDLAGQVKNVGGYISLGYDIKSFTDKGEVKRIEVKSTVYGLNHNKFFISKSEVEKSKTIENYYLYLVYDLDGQPVIKYIKSPDFDNKELFELIPQKYEVRYRHE